jgi:DnaJ-domain-containing protein 1
MVFPFTLNYMNSANTNDPSVHQKADDENTRQEIEMSITSCGARIVLGND